MTLSRRTVGIALIGTGAVLLVGPAVVRLFAGQDTPNRREFTLVAKDFRFSPARIEVTQDDLVKLTVESGDVAYGFAIDQYKIARRVPPGGKTVIEFRADQAGTWPYYSHMTSDARHAKMRGELVVRRR